MEKISIIIPVYKVERYLCECIDSVRASTYTNLEIILVDDGSPDSSPRICDEYAQKDSRIRVIHQENRGLCAARNAGLGIATGKYVAFVDSDDMVSPVMYEELVRAIESEKADWAACEYTRERKKLVTERPSVLPVIRILEGTEALLSVLTCAPSVRNITWTSGLVWDKLYCRESIAKEFVVGCLNTEDLKFNWDYLQENSRLAIVPAQLYYYRINESSITETYRKSKADNLAERVRSLVQVSESITQQLPSDCPVIKQYMTARTVNLMHGALFRLHAHGIAAQHPDFCTHSGRYIRKHWKTVWMETETYNLRAKLPVALFVFAYPLWVLATKILKL